MFCGLGWVIQYFCTQFTLFDTSNSSAHTCSWIAWFCLDNIWSFNPEMNNCPRTTTSGILWGLKNIVQEVWMVPYTFLWDGFNFRLLELTKWRLLGMDSREEEVNSVHACQVKNWGNIRTTPVFRSPNKTALMLWGWILCLVVIWGKCFWVFYSNKDSSSRLLHLYIMQKKGTSVCLLCFSMMYCHVLTWWKGYISYFYHPCRHCAQDVFTLSRGYAII